MLDAVDREIKSFAKIGGTAEVPAMADPWKINLPDGVPSSKAAGSLSPPNEPLFKTITAEDWKRSLALARQQSNAVSEQIRTVISSSSPKTK